LFVSFYRDGSENIIELNFESGGVRKYQQDTHPPLNSVAHALLSFSTDALLPPTPCSFFFLHQKYQQELISFNAHALPLFLSPSTPCRPQICRTGGHAHPPHRRATAADRAHVALRSAAREGHRRLKSTAHRQSLLK
jgi:hypothetical protein